MRCISRRFRAQTTKSRLRGASAARSNSRGGNGMKIYFATDASPSPQVRGGVRYNHCGRQDSRAHCSDQPGGGKRDSVGNKLMSDPGRYKAKMEIPAYGVFF